MNLQEKLQAIANHYGMDLQAIKLAEEGAELAAATLKNVGLMIQQENGEGGESIAQKRAEAMEKTDEEIADVLLVSRQMEYLLLESPKYDEKITRLMNEKADRQLSRIKEEENEHRISLKQTTENIQIPDWAKTIVIHADTTAPYSEKKLQQIYWLFFKTLGITDESRKKYTLRFHVRFARPDCDYYVEFADMIINDRVRF